MGDFGKWALFDFYTLPIDINRHRVLLTLRQAPVCLPDGSYNLPSGLRWYLLSSGRDPCRAGGSLALPVRETLTGGYAPSKIVLRY
jgi:hypothetical protein